MFHPRPNSKLDSIPSAKGPNLATESTVTFIWAQVEGPRCETSAFFARKKIPKDPWDERIFTYMDG